MKVAITLKIFSKTLSVLFLILFPSGDIFRIKNMASRCIYFKYKKGNSGKPSEVVAHINRYTWFILNFVNVKFLFCVYENYKNSCISTKNYIQLNKKHRSKLPLY